ncbi:MAG: aldo/keto reductase [Anaerolineae bacterium]
MAAETVRNGIPLRPLGRTGEWVTILGVGGYHMGNPGTEGGISIVRTAIDEGVNFLDNACDYHEGESEIIMGKALRDGYRQRVFLMTKNHGRDAASYRSTLERSLRRLQTDVIDLVQFHEIVEEDAPRAIFTRGAIEEAVKARDQGKIRFIGFTGHQWPHLFREMLGYDFAWDTVQMPVGLLDYHFRSFAREILPTLIERSIGAIGMKSLSSGRLMETGVSVADGLHYALSQPIGTLVSGMESVEQLQQNLATVRSFRPLTGEEQRVLLERVAPLARDGTLEEHKTG